MRNITTPDQAIYPKIFIRELTQLGSIVFVTQVRLQHTDGLWYRMYVAESCANTKGEILDATCRLHRTVHMAMHLQRVDPNAKFPDSSVPPFGTSYPNNMAFHLDEDQRSEMERFTPDALRLVDKLRYCQDQEDKYRNNAKLIMKQICQERMKPSDTTPESQSGA